MVTRNEAVALKWAEKYLRHHVCQKCGNEWISGVSTTTVFHRCVRPRETVNWYRGREERVYEDNRRWALTAFGGAVEDAVGDKALLE